MGQQDQQDLLNSQLHKVWIQGLLPRLLPMLLGMTTILFCQPGKKMLLCRLKANRIFDPAGFKERFPYSIVEIFDSMPARRSCLKLSLNSDMGGSQPKASSKSEWMENPYIKSLTIHILMNSPFFELDPLGNESRGKKRAREWSGLRGCTSKVWLSIHLSMESTHWKREGDVRVQSCLVIWDISILLVGDGPYLVLLCLIGVERIPYFDSNLALTLRDEFSLWSQVL